MSAYTHPRHPAAQCAEGGDQQGILRQIRGQGSESKTSYLRVYLAALRRKLESDPTSPRHLLTEPGMGYRFEP